MALPNLHPLQIGVNGAVIALNLPVRRGILEVLKSAVMLQGLSHVVTITSLVVFEGRELGVKLTHHTLHIVIFAHL